MFVFVTLLPSSLLVTYSLKINSLLFLTHPAYQLKFVLVLKKCDWKTTITTGLEGCRQVASNAPVILEKCHSVLVVFIRKCCFVLNVYWWLKIPRVQFGFAKTKATKINLNTNSPTFRAAKLKGFTVLSSWCLSDSVLSYTVHSGYS